MLGTKGSHVEICSWRAVQCNTVPPVTHHPLHEPTRQPVALARPDGLSGRPVSDAHHPAVPPITRHSRPSVTADGLYWWADLTPVCRWSRPNGPSDRADATGRRVASYSAAFINRHMFAMLSFNFLKATHTVHNFATGIIIKDCQVFG